MNGIVTGKTEKSGLMWKTAITGNIPTQATTLMYIYVSNTSYLTSPYWLKIVEGTTRTAYISMNYIRTVNVFPSTYFDVDTGMGYYLEIARDYDNQRLTLVVGDSDNLRIKDYLDSVEIGTFE